MISQVTNAAQLLGHFDLVAAWVLPAMALSLVLVILSALGLKVRHRV